MLSSPDSCVRFNMFLVSVVGIPHEYCHLEAFNASCARDEIVVMTSAMFGRMHVGGCVKRNLGYVGCAENVLTYLDGLCSGRSHCTMKIVDLAHVKQPCPADVTSYLEASYSCHPGEFMELM